MTSDVTTRKESARSRLQDQLERSEAFVYDDDGHLLRATRVFTFTGSTEEVLRSGLTRFHQWATRNLHGVLFLFTLVAASFGPIGAFTAGVPAGWCWAIAGAVVAAMIGVAAAVHGYVESGSIEARYVVTAELAHTSYRLDCKLRALLTDPVHLADLDVVDAGVNQLLMELETALGNWRAVQCTPKHLIEDWDERWIQYAAQVQNIRNEITDVLADLTVLMWDAQAAPKATSSTPSTPWVAPKSFARDEHVHEQMRAALARLTSPQA